MSKFLDLVNEFARSVSVTPTAPTGSLMGLFTKLCDTLQVDCEQTNGGLLIKISEEEAEDMSKYTSTSAIDSNVEGLAAKANMGSKIFGTASGRAKQAVKERQQLAPTMVKAYQDITNQIKSALLNRSTSSTTTI